MCSPPNMAPASDYYEEAQCGEAEVDHEEPVASEKEEQDVQNESGSEAGEASAEEGDSARRSAEETVDEGSLLRSSPARKASSGGSTESKAADLGAPATEQDGWEAWKKKGLKEFAHPDNKDDWKKEELVDMDFWRMPLAPLSP